MVPSSFTDKMKLAIKHIEQARAIMACGPLDFYLEKLVNHSEALLTRFAPLKIGQKAIIVNKVECKNNWSGKEKTLALGATGTIDDVDFDDGKFFFGFVPDHDWWLDRDGNYNVCETKHSYCLSEQFLSAVPCVVQNDYEVA